MPRRGESAPVTAALTLSLTGPFARQGIDAADGVRLWAEASGIRLSVVDDGGSRERAIRAYSGWLGRGDVDLLLGPYSSGLTRAVVPLAQEAGQLLWNHGGSADDLMQPAVVTLPSPASRYFDGVVDEAIARDVTRMLVVQGSGPFARAVAEGASARAAGRGLDVRIVGEPPPGEEVSSDLAVLTAGRFEHDVEIVRHLGDGRHVPALVGAVAAGIPAFERELGARGVEGVLGPVHWWPTSEAPAIGPSGEEFAAAYRRHSGREPAYVAAQAAAAGYLAHAFHERRSATGDLQRWRTTTLLGPFALDADWRQIGHAMTTVVWRDGRMIPLR